MNNGSWKEISVREKMQIFNGTMLVFSAIVLYFLAFIITLSIGFEIISAGATLLGTGLAFFGITSFLKNQMIEMETRIDRKLKSYEQQQQQ